jgi:hypothetical protein
MSSDKLIYNVSLQHISAFSFCHSLSLLIFTFHLSFSLLLLSIPPFPFLSFLSTLFSLPPLPCHLSPFYFSLLFLFSFAFLPTIFFNSSRVSFFVLSHVFLPSFSFFHTQKKLRNPCYQIGYCTSGISTGATLVCFCLQQHVIPSQSMR